MVAKVVVQQHHVAGFFADIGAGDAHGDADIRLLQGRGIVDPIAGHGDNWPCFLQGLHDAQLVLGGDAGIDMDLLNRRF
jgi:hypothetical protein